MPLRPRAPRLSRPVPEVPADTPIPEQAWHRVPADELVTLVSAALMAQGFPEERARPAAEALCHGDLTGAPETGVGELTRVHLPAIESGFVSPGAQPLLIADRGAAALIDYRRASGLWAVGDAMDRAVQRAGRFGVGLLSLRGVGPFGRVGHHAARALPHGMIGMVMAAGGYADQPVHPLGMAAPAGAYPEFVLDVDLADTARNPQFAGFALMVDVLAGVLSGVADHEHDTGLLVLAIAPTTLRSADGFYRAASAVFGSMLGWEGGAPVRYPGWREAQYLEQCRALGVPLPGAVRRQLDSLALKLGRAPLTTVG
ncbi:Ldh family oxidoreductase [Amycolatopsis rubida]|uniref:Ldh family oxidoreductase n=2 Tax=Amycolatopsis rubida TaxID=112413 RepID=A0ABX0C721_9PSEU|nr:MULTISPECIES: Ldh family oxidoreductase [Amycolatopsis]MYW97148.1 lactate dehydrogenase [Amycolatopsis rubida]NEC62133.1 Ldh family oxidoreductase [Amycolatopsis rubida]